MLADIGSLDGGGSGSGDVDINRAWERRIGYMKFQLQSVWVIVS